MRSFTSLTGKFSMKTAHSVLDTVHIMLKRLKLGTEKRTKWNVREEKYKKILFTKLGG
jgi:hypothetical protein